MAAENMTFPSNGHTSQENGAAGSHPAPAPPSQTAGHPSFRRQRASKACEVRCDAASLGVPCTNCVAFSIECRIPTPKRKKTQTKIKDDQSERSESTPSTAPSRDATQILSSRSNASLYTPPTAPPSASLPDMQAPPPPPNGNDPVYGSLMKPKFARAPIKEAGRVAYLGESSNLSLLVQDRHGSSDVVHYPLPENIRGSRARLDELDQIEIEILKQRGAFLLPPRELCDELIESYFKWVAPVVPIVNRSRFMRRYQDSKNPPSLLLLQAMLLAGSRVCTNPQLMDASGSTTPAAMTFYKRAKALYDANYEDDRVTIVQSLILMGWYWEGPEGQPDIPSEGSKMNVKHADTALDVTKNVFYWSRVALVVAQGSGMHRSVEGSQLSKADKRLWKRIWWTLFTRDRSVAVALGRPVHINTDDSDVEMVTEDDFIDDEEGYPADYPPDPVHVQFFLQYLRLCEIMGLVLSQQYSVASKARRTSALDLTHSDMALADWLQNCPKEVFWVKEEHHFWSATTLCLLHRAHMPPATTNHGPTPEDVAYPSRTIAFQAAAMITSIIECLETHNELNYAPAFIIYSLFSALIMHVYQMRSSIPQVITEVQNKLRICMDALKKVSKVWLAAKMVHTLFESILGNKVLEERFQKAAGTRHKKSKQNTHNTFNSLGGFQKRSADPPKRKFDDMEMGFTNGPPAPQVSYERSRPQSPTNQPSTREMLGSSSMGLPHQSPNIRQHSSDAFMTGNHQGQTRPTTPFNHSYSVPGTPPEFYLVTRNSPPISQSLWENFQPDQLFPEGADMSLSHFPSPVPQPLDPQLQMAGQHPMQAAPPGVQNLQAQMHNPSPHQIPHRGPHDSPIGGMPPQAPMGGMPSQMMPQQQHQSQHAQNWQHASQPQQSQQQHAIDPGLTNGPGAMEGQSPEDSWSTSSRGGQGMIPPTLNVEDWFQFFGINGDLNATGMNVNIPEMG
ncbi:MAG: Transcriptional activator of fatty acid utilization [Cirrosporium novae-zelandiae]|nr:MAG: Transcriptional activator of fatty acid utilization [Cirrosporium novae-zelandiae]